MDARRDGKTHVVRLDRGESAIASLQKYLGENDIRGGVIIGIGAVEQSELGYFVVAEKRYLRRVFPESRELVSFVGTISRLDGSPFVHAHAALGGPEYDVVAGHLFEGRISVTGEFVIHEADIASRRIQDAVTGLRLMRFERGE